MKNAKRIFTLALAILMMLALIAPAFAATGDYVITIKNNDLNSAADHVYEAYQIFSGKLDTTGTILSDPEWGINVDNPVSFVDDLKAEADFEVDGVNIFAAVDSSAANSAKLVADILALPAHHTSTIVNAFGKVATAHLTGSPVAVSGAMTVDGTKGIYTIEVPQSMPGYYLVKDDPTALAGKENKDVSDYIVQVVGNVTVEHKGSIPTLDKQVSETGESYHDSIATGIGEKHVYRIIAELPDDYTNFDEYYLEFSDNMSEGLTYMGIERVYVVIRSSNTRLTLDDTCYSVGTTPSTVKPGGTHLRIVINDTKTITSGGTAITLTPEDAVVVIYNAYVNSKAVVDGNGIENEATIIYSNDPNTDGKGESNPDETHVYPINLKLQKVDGKDATKLDNAKFVLSRLYNDGSTTKTQYAQIDANKKISGWVEHHIKDGCAADNAAHMAAVSGGKMASVLTTVGGEFNVVGLDAGSYSLEEIEAPDGYNKLAQAINLTVSITVDESTDKIASMSGTTNQGNITFQATTGTVSISIPNYKGNVLPSTGGMGTTLFYLVGGAMALCALVLLITKKRMNYQN